jgi:TonB family protein
MAGAADLIGGAHDYVLTSDLAKLCLPQTFKDENKRLAWANSICILFLIIGLIGLKPPKIVQRPLSEVADTVPVELFNPPEEKQQAQPEKPPENEPPPDTDVTDQPVIATVAVANPASVAFAVPVKGPVMVTKSAAYATPPPANLNAAPRPTTFNPSVATGGYYPDPTYPRTELMARHEGKVMLYVVVDPSGTISSVAVRDSCGWAGLDRHAADWVRERWRFLPGEVRHYLVPIIFQIR